MKYPKIPYTWTVWKIICLNQKRINSVLNIYLHLKNIWNDDFTLSITNPFWNMCLNFLIKISCLPFVDKRDILSVFSAETLWTQGKRLTRDSSAINRSFVVSFFTQRHPQTKTNTTERNDGLSDGRKSRSRRDSEEFEDFISAACQSSHAYEDGGTWETCQ